MSIEWYVGSDGFTVEDADVSTVYSALDNMHTQVLDRIDARSTGEDEALLRWLSKAMDDLVTQFPEADFL
jgi:hypothetical protein